MRAKTAAVDAHREDGDPNAAVAPLVEPRAAAAPEERARGGPASVQLLAFLLLAIGAAGLTVLWLPVMRTRARPLLVHAGAAARARVRVAGGATRAAAAAAGGTLERSRFSRYTLAPPTAAEPEVHHEPDGALAVTERPELEEQDAVAPADEPDGAEELLAAFEMRADAEADEPAEADDLADAHGTYEEEDKAQEESEPNAAFAFASAPGVPDADAPSGEEDEAQEESELEEAFAFAPAPDAVHDARAANLDPADTLPAADLEHACLDCGTPLPAHAYFCFSCGAAREADENGNGHARDVDAELEGELLDPAAGAPALVVRDLYGPGVLVIDFWRGYVKGEFVATVSDGEASFVAARSPAFWFLRRGEPAEDDPRAVRPYERLVGTLTADRWEPVARGTPWYAYYFRRRTNGDDVPAGAGSPGNGSIDQPTNGSGPES